MAHVEAGPARLACFACGNKLEDPVSSDMVFPPPSTAASGSQAGADPAFATSRPSRSDFGRRSGAGRPRPASGKGTWHGAGDGTVVRLRAQSATASECSSVDGACSNSSSIVTEAEAPLRSLAAPVPACGSCLTGGHFPGCRPIRSRGYWNPCCPCLFGSLSAGVLSHTMSFLGPRDVAALAAVSSRFAWASASSELWSRTTLRITSAGGPSAHLVASESKEALATSPDRPDAAHPPSALASPGGSEAQPLSASGLAGLVRLHGPAIRRLEARGLDPAAFGSAAPSAAAGDALPAALRPIARLAGLRDLDLSGSKRLPGRAVVTLAAPHRGLRRLVLAGCAALTDADVTDLLCRGQSLEELSLARCRLLGPPALAALAASASAASLHTLDLSGLPGITADDVIGTVLARPLPSLRRLFLTGLRGAGDALLAAVATACPSLRVLDVGASDATGCVAALTARRGGDEVTCAGLQALAAAPCGETLRVLGLRGRSRLAEDVAATETALASMRALDRADMALSARAVAGVLRGDASARARLERLQAVCDGVGTAE